MMPLLALDERELERLQGVAGEATAGPWDVHLTTHPHCLGGAHREWRIQTSWTHGQLKAPYPVITTSIGLPADTGGKATHMVAMRAEDAAYIAEFNPAVALQLIALAKQALAAK